MFIAEPDCADFSAAAVFLTETGHGRKIGAMGFSPGISCYSSKNVIGGIDYEFSDLSKRLFFDLNQASR